MSCFFLANPVYIYIYKDKGQECEIEWSILRKSTPYRAGSKQCNLCLWEKLYIMKGNKDILINKKDELVSKCRHVDKFLLSKFKDRNR